MRKNIVNARIYRVWNLMKDRCTNTNSKSYKTYGGRGISVCDEWAKSSRSFYNWAVANGYKEGLSIDRIDNNKGYSPDNCRWVDRKTQARNKTSNVIIEYNGESKTLIEWCEKYKLDYKRTHNRLFKLGWSFERAISEPVHKNKRNKATRNRKDKYTTN